MKLKNYMEDVIRATLEELLAKRKNTEVCTCNRCRMDVIAYALNHMPPKYVVTDKGHMFTRVAEMQQQFEASVVVALSKGMKQVAKNPRH